MVGNDVLKKCILRVDRNSAVVFQSVLMSILIENAYFY